MPQKRNLAMDDMRDFVLEDLASDRKLIRLRATVSAAEFTFPIKADGTLGEQCEVALGLMELRSGAPIDIDDHPAVNALIAKARKAAEIFLVNAP
jgi:hypothetical protein